MTKSAVATRPADASTTCPKLRKRPRLSTRLSSSSLRTYYHDSHSQGLWYFLVQSSATSQIY